MKHTVPVFCVLESDWCRDRLAGDAEDWFLCADGGELNDKTLRGEVAAKNDGLQS